MIRRVWHGRTKKEDADIYKQYVIDSGILEYLKTDGNLDTEIWQEDEGNITHIYTVTRWKDLKSIKAFSGEDIEKAKYYLEDKKYLLEFEPTVKHYNTLSLSNSRMKNYIRQIEDLYDGDNWTDENFSKKINKLKEETAFKQPAKGKHSAAEILWHCIYWRKVLIKRMEGDWEFGKITEEEQNFLSLELLKKKGWKRLLAEFKESKK